MRQRKIKENHIVIVLCFLMVCVALGFCSSSKSLFIAPITEALGISRSAFSVNDSVRFITSSIINLFFGTLIGKFGAKKLICAGFISLIISCVIYSLAQSVYLFYLGGVFLGLGFSWTTTTMVGFVIHKWCRKNTGTVMGAVLASNGIGAAIAMQILSPIIYREGNPFAYQDAYRLVALLLLVVAVLVAIFFKNEPSHPEDGEMAAVKKRRGRSWPGIAWSDAVKRVYFYGTLICIFLIGLMLQGISGIVAPHLGDVGLTPAFVTTAMSAHAISLTCFKFLTGFLYDRFGLRITSGICLVTAAVVFILLSLVSNSPIGKVLALTYCILSALALPLETVLLPIFAGDLFGEKSYDKVLGIVVSVNTAGYAVGAPAINLCYDLTGSYNTGLYIGCGLMLAVLIAMQFVISAANREHQKAEMK